MTAPEPGAVCRGLLAQDWPGERPCRFRATHPDGLCGIHHNAAHRRAKAAEPFLALSEELADLAVQDVEDDALAERLIRIAGQIRRLPKPPG